jgi:hypothetical protein
MRRIEDVVHGMSTYVKYGANGSHNSVLLRALGLPSDLADTVAAQVSTSDRLNVSRTHKQVAAAVNARNLLCGGRGSSFGSRMLLQAFDSGRLHFDEDGPCELFGGGLRQELHRQALGAARKIGFDPYPGFFGNQTPGEIPARVSVAPDALNRQDLTRIQALSPS